MRKPLPLLAMMTMLCACGSGADAPVDAGPGDAQVADSGPADVGGDTSAQTDAAKPFTKPTPFAVALSGTGPDQLQSVTAGPNGTFYAAGFVATTAAGPKLVTVVKLTTTGLDPSFGAGGVAKTAIEFAGGAGEIDLAVQPSGKIVVSATVANAIATADRDVAVFRLDATGALDATFGDAGVRVIDFNTALDASQSAQRDAARGIALGPGGVIYVSAVQRGLLARTDSDYGVAKLTVDGAVDATFASGGKFSLDFGTPSANATARGIRALPGGGVIVAGYASSSISGNTTQPVLFKLTSGGALDSAFGDNGIFHAPVLTLQTEAYAVALHGGSLVTGGYGRNTGTTNDWVSLRFDATTGVRDTKWGNAPNGAVLFDPSGKALGSACRNAIGLPGGKTLLLGSTGPSNTTTQDAVFAVLDANGVLDTSYGTGVQVFPLGSGEGGSDQFWSGAVSGTNVLVVGFRGAGTTQTDQLNDDAYAVAFPLQ